MDCKKSGKGVDRRDIAYTVNSTLIHDLAPSLFSGRNDNVLLLKLIFLQLLRPFDKCFRRSIEKEEFGIQIFFESEFTRLSDQINIEAELKYFVNIWHLGVDYFEGHIIKQSSNQTRDDEDEGSVQSQDTVE